MVRKSPLPILILAVVFLFVNLSTHAQEMRVAMVDFAVHSRNSDYEFLGKGISEMIAVELANSSGVTLVDREKRSELMEEMRFALSGLAEDTDRQMEVGKLLAVDYIIFGEIVDMAPQLLISVRVTGVDSGEVVYQDNLTERPGRYEYISGYFASNILDHFDVRVAQSTKKKVEEKQEKQEEAVVAFSRALAAYDKGEEEEAKKELVEAKRIDPEYEAAQVYLNKLTSNASRFKVMPEHYLSFQNPAYLGIIQKDYLSIISSKQDPVHDPTFITYDSGSKTGSGESSEYENYRYSFPIRPGWGAGVEFIRSSINVAITGPEGYDHNIGSNYIDFYNLILTSGFRLNDSIAVGVGGSCMLRSRDYYKISWHSDPDFDGKYKKEKDVVWGAETGILLQFLDDSLFFDSHIAYSSNWFEYYRVKTDEFDPVEVPLIFDNSLTYAFNRKRSYLTLGQQNQIYIEEDYYGGKLIPAFEQWIFELFGVRGGFEATYLKMGSFSKWGWGATGGVSLRLNFLGGDWYLDANYTYRQRISRALEELVIDEHVVFVTISRRGLFFR